MERLRSEQKDLNKAAGEVQTSLESKTVKGTYWEEGAGRHFYPKLIFRR